jgi:hypothetical protein
VGRTDGRSAGVRRLALAVLDPEQRIYDDRSIDGTFLIESGWRVDPHDAAARINWTTRYEPRGLMRLLAPVLGTIIRRGPDR